MHWKQKRPDCQGNEVVYVPLRGVAPKARQIAQVQNADQIATLEGYLARGIFGSWLLESLVHPQYLRACISEFALGPVICGIVGPQSALNAAAGLR